MKDEECGVCRSIGASPAIWEDARWVVRHIDPPCGVAGWMVLIARRHVAGPAHFDDAEAATFGPVLRHAERVLEQVTGALRIYSAALGERWPHFHCHMVPRYADAPAKGWALFDLERAAHAGEICVDEVEVARVVARYAAALRADPPPR